jgi:TRAP-type C4-dicarboxylate transport system substrate-binding protein
MMRIAGVLAIMLGLVLGACSKPLPPGTIELTYASPYPATHTFSRADITWMRWIEVQSHGHLRIRPYWGGALLSSNENMLEIRHGIADIGMITPMYARSAHLQRVQSSFYSGIRSIPDQIAVYKCLAAAYPEMNAEANGLHLLAIQGGNVPGILTRKRPIRTLADLKGLRLRAQEDTAAVLRTFGADPVNMSMAEVYSAMAKGVIDGVVAPADSLKAVHLADVGRYFSTLKVPRGAYPGRAMSQALWQRLSPTDQDLFTRGELVWEQAMNSELAAALTAGEHYAQSEKIEIVPLAPGEQSRFDALYRANAFRLGRGLKPYGINGEPIARRAAALIAARDASGTMTCETGRPS